MTTTITDPRVLKMLDEWDQKHGKAQAELIERLKQEPCEFCGSRSDVEVIAWGSLAKWTPVCKKCRR